MFNAILKKKIRGVQKVKKLFKVKTHNKEQKEKYIEDEYLGKKFDELKKQYFQY